MRSLIVAVLAFSALLAVQAAMNPPSGLNTVYVQLQFNQIAKVDGVEQSYECDFYMTTYWAAPKDSVNTTVDTPLEDNNIGNFWSPGLEFINGRGEVTRIFDQPYSFVDRPKWVPDSHVIPDDWIWLLSDQRYFGSFTTLLEMRDFPYDRQSAFLWIESFWDQTQVKIEFAEPSSIDYIIPDYMPEVVGWDLKGNSYSKQSQLYEYNNRYYDRLVISVRLERQPEYFLTKIVTGVLLLVYMCFWIFALQIDEADRMMGTLSTFAGLVTYLFVAAGDVPKVPYQTRLDLFMMWSFFVVAFCLFTHGTVYYWRECDVEEELERRAAAKKRKAKGTASEQGTDIEMQQMNDNGNDQKKGKAEPQAEFDENVWRIREHPRPPFTLKRWFHGLHFTRKCDAIIVPSLYIGYSIGVAVIFGRPVSG